jgi:hypothetical protein
LHDRGWHDDIQRRLGLWEGKGKRQPNHHRSGSAKGCPPKPTSEWSHRSTLWRRIHCAPTAYHRRSHTPVASSIPQSPADKLRRHPAAVATSWPGRRLCCCSRVVPKGARIPERGCARLAWRSLVQARGFRPQRVVWCSLVADTVTESRGAANGRESLRSGCNDEEESLLPRGVCLS